MEGMYFLRPLANAECILSRYLDTHLKTHCHPECIAGISPS